MQEQIRRALYLSVGVALLIILIGNFYSSNTLYAEQTDSPRQTEIVGGQDVPDSNPYVWQVSIGYRGVDNADDENQGHFCGGSVIGDKWILTAAHCLTSEETGNEDPNTLRVVIGRRVRSQSGTGIEIDVASFTLHENYQGINDGSDIAIIELASTIPNVSQYVVPMITTAQEATLSPAGTTATTSGWGGLQGYSPEEEGPEGGQTFPDVLQMVEVPIVSNETCNALESYDGSILDSMVCAGLAEGGRDSCQNDSGGPLVVPDPSGDFIQVGVTSFGRGCASPNFYGVYTRVSSFTDWIQSKTGIAIGETATATPAPTNTPAPTDTPVPVDTPTAVPTPTSATPSTSNLDFTSEVDPDSVNDDGNAQPGATVVIIFWVENIGEQAVDTATLSVIIPPNTTFNAASSTAGWQSGSTTAKSTLVDCPDGAAAGSLCTFTLTNIAPTDLVSTDLALTLDATLPAEVTSLQLDTQLLVNDGSAQPSSIPNTLSVGISSTSSEFLVFLPLINR